MNRRQSNADLKALYPDGLEALLTRQQQEDSPQLPDLDQANYPVMSIKRKKQSSLLKSILQEGGYGDLAKQVSLKRQ